MRSTTVLGPRPMKLVIAFFFVMSQLLGAQVNASKGTDSGLIPDVPRHIESLRVNEADFLINKNGLSLQAFNLIVLENENEEPLYKKLVSPTGRLLFLCSTVGSDYEHTSSLSIPFLCRPLPAVSYCKYIVFRVLRI